MGTASIFISYAHADEEWLTRLVTHLGVIEHQQLLDIWTDRTIEAGAGWYEAIRAAITAAKIAVLLVTPSFLGSLFIRTEEVPRLMERRAKEGLNVVPIIVKPCAWELAPWLKEMQVRPKDARALSSGQDHQIDQDLADITREIYEMLLRGRGASGSSPGPTDDSDARMRPLRASEPLPPEIVADPTSMNVAMVTDAAETAGAWLQALMEGEFAAAWRLSDDNWRLCRAQAWIWSNQQLLGLNDLEAAQKMAEELSATTSRHPLWPEFARIERDQFLESTAWVPAGGLGFATRRRSVGPGYELFQVAPLGDHKHGVVVNRETTLKGFSILTHLTADGWRVAAYGVSSPPRPGWPPAWWVHDPVAATATDQMLLERRRQ